jgi:hypothetical protein
MNPRLLRIDTNDRANRNRYHYLYWTVSDPATPVIYYKGKWYALQHSKATGKPYHDGQTVDVYPVLQEVPKPQHTNTSKELPDPTDLQIRNTPAVIEPSGPGSPHRPRSIEQRTPSRLVDVTDTCNSNPMATQTMESQTEMVQRALVSGETSNTSNTTLHQNPSHIRDTFNIALG